MHYNLGLVIGAKLGNTTMLQPQEPNGLKRYGPNYNITN